MISRKSTAGHGLLELLLVFILIAVIATFGVSDCSGRIAKKKTAHTEMSTIQAAFRRCYDDCKLNKDDMALFARFGLWPLSQNTEPSIAAIPPRPDRAGGLVSQDTENFAQLIGEKLSKNWRGPYLTCNAFETFSISTFNAGQDTGLNEENPSENRTLPVQTDTWSPEYDPNKTRRLSYYRIIIPMSAEGVRYPEFVALVCTGPNKKLNTQATDIDPVTHELVAQKDDIVLRLLPRE